VVADGSLSRRLEIGRKTVAHPDEEATEAALADDGDASARYAHDLITYARAWSSARDRYAADPDRNRPPSTREIRLPRLPLSVKPVSDEGDGGSSAPPLDRGLSRRDRIRAFAGFLEAEAHNLANHASQPLFCLQQAYNSAASGPVHDRARKVLESGNDAVALLCHSSSLLPFNPNPALLRTLGGHERVRAVDVTPDGRIALSGGGNVLRTWEVESGRWIRELRVDPPEDVRAVWLSPDGRFAVTGSHAMVAIPGLVTLRVWDLENGRCLRAIIGPHLEAISVSADCRLAFLASDGGLSVCDLEKDESFRPLEEAFGACAVSVTPEGLVGISGERRRLEVWNIERAERVAVLEGHQGAILGVAISADGHTAISASEDGTLRIWDIEGLICRGTLKGHSGYVQSVSLTPDGRVAVSGGMDKTLRVWNVETRECVRVIEVDTEWNMAVSIAADGSLAVAAGERANLHVWDIKTGSRVRRRGHSRGVGAASLTPDSRIALSLSRTELKLWDVQSGQCIRKTEVRQVLGSSLNITPDGSRFVTFKFNDPGSHCLVVHDLGSLGRLHELGERKEWISEVHLSPDGRLAVAATVEGKLNIWDLESAQLLHSVQTPADRVDHFSMTPDGFAVAGGALWDVYSGRAVKAINHDAMSITSDGRFALSQTFDNLILVWDLRTGQCLREIGSPHKHPGQGSWIHSISLTPDGVIAIAVGPDHRLRAWSVRTGECLAVGAIGGEVDVHAARGWLLVVGDQHGSLYFLDIFHQHRALPRITPVRLWSFGQDGAAGAWDESITALCEFCGKRFDVSRDVLETLSALTAPLPPDNAPSLSLPAAALDEPRLLSECPHCHRPLRFNPFIVDNRDR